MKLSHVHRSSLSCLLLLAAQLAVAVASTAETNEFPARLEQVTSAVSVSGYVDTSAEWNFGTGNANLPRYKFGGSGKADGFNLDVVQLRFDKPLTDAAWSAGYRVDLWAGPDAAALGTRSTLSSSASDFAVRQAYLALGVPLGNGVDLKLGVFDSLIGYESLESPSNANFTRSFGRSIEPQTHTGIVAHYRFNELFDASIGAADTVNSSINSRAQQGSAGGYFGGVFGGVPPGQNAYAESYKAYMGAFRISAPNNLGWFSGSSLSFGIVNGFNNSGGLTNAFSDPTFGSVVGVPQMNIYAGLDLATPIKTLRVGAAFDWLNFDSVARYSIGTTPVAPFSVDAETWTLAGYASYQATDRLSFHGRYEYVDSRIDSPFQFTGKTRLMAATVTAQYDLWRNVLSRLELRWDHLIEHEDSLGGGVPGIKDNAWMLAANIIYKF